MARNYVSNKNETVRMFKSDFLEFFSHIHPATPAIVYLPLVAYLLYYATARQHTDMWAIIGLFMFGVLLWTFAEYMLHRFVFHYQPKTDLGKRVHFLIHGVHHDYPSDATRLVFPPAFSIPLAVGFFFLFRLTLGFEFCLPTFGGFIVGYLGYDTLHYAFHHLPMKGGLLLKLKQYHARHHYGDMDVGYGVSSPLWDYVFGTVERRKSEK